MSYSIAAVDGHDWLGAVPQTWVVRKLKHCLFASNERNNDAPVGEMLSVSGYRGIEVKEYEAENQKRTVEELRDYRVVRPNQMVINTMWLNHAGLGVSDLTGHVSPAYKAYFLSDDLVPRFLHHLMRSSIYVRGYTKYMQGIRPNSLQIKTEDFAQFPILIPSRDEQFHIATVLDYETAKIDSLIDKQQQLIALLKEKRQAVISHAVTRGLNPDAPMKDSGIEWLGQVPAHWEVAQLGHKTQEVTVGIVQTPAKFYQDDGVPCLRSLNVRPGYLRAEDLVFISPDANDLHEKSKIYRDDLVVVRTGQPGTTAAVDERFDGCNCIDLIIVRKSAEILSNFLVYLMNSEFAAIQVAAGSGGAIQQHFNVGVAKKLRVIVPPPAEQHLIVDFLDTRTAKLDKLIGNAERTVDLLQERRTALISAAVTGKIDVRGWKPPEGGEGREGV